jgi:hypothetical protein
VPDAFHALTWANFHTAIDGYEAYFDRISTTHPNPKLREAILSYAFSVASYAGDRERMAQIYERLVGDFPDSQAVAVARKQVGPDRRVRVGAPVPDFRVVALDDPATVYTRTEMLGESTSSTSGGRGAGRAWPKCPTCTRLSSATGHGGSRS